MKDYEKYDQSVTQERLLAAAKLSGYKLRELAEEMGIAEGTFSGYLYTLKPVPLKNLYKICLVLGLTADYVMGLVDVNET